jgi:hypothetical protein
VSEYDSVPVCYGFNLRRATDACSFATADTSSYATADTISDTGADII